MINYYKNYKTGEYKELYKDKEKEQIKGKILLQFLDKNGEVIEEQFSENLITNEAINNMFYNLNRGTYCLDTNTFTNSNFGHMLLVNNKNLLEDKKYKKIDITKDIVKGFANVCFPTRTTLEKQGTIDRDYTSFNSETGEITVFSKFTYDKANFGEFTHICFGAESEFIDINAEPIYFGNKIIEKIGIIDDLDLKMVTFNKKGECFYFNKIDRSFYKVLENNVGYIKTLSKSEKLYEIDINLEILGDVHYFIYNNITDTFFLVCNNTTTNKIYTIEFTNTFNYLRTYAEIEIPDLDLESKSKKAIFFNNYLMILTNGTDLYYYSNSANLNIYKLNDDNNIVFKKTILLKENVKEISCISNNGEYIYLNYIKDDIAHVSLFNFKEQIIEGTEDKEVILTELITNKLKAHRINNIYTYTYPLKDSFITTAGDGYNTYSNYISHSIFNFGSISLLPQVGVKTDAVELLIRYMFKVDYTSTGVQ